MFKHQAPSISNFLAKPKLVLGSDMWVGLFGTLGHRVGFGEWCGSKIEDRRTVWIKAYGSLDKTEGPEGHEWGLNIT